MSAKNTHASNYVTTLNNALINNRIRAHVAASLELLATAAAPEPAAAAAGVPASMLLLLLLGEVGHPGAEAAVVRVVA